MGVDCELCTAPIVETKVKYSEIILNPTSGTQVKVSDVLKQHFWFNLDNAVLDDQFVCGNCWSKASAFHDFYEEVRAVHMLKGDPCYKRTASVYHESDGDVEFEEYQHNGYSIADGCVSVMDERGVDEKGSLEKLLQLEPCHLETNEVSDENRPEVSKGSIDCKPGVDECPAKRRRGRPRKYEHFDENVSKSPPERHRPDLSYELVAKHFSMECDLCYAKLTDLQDAKNHYKSEHRTCGYLICCGKKFDRRRAIREHCLFHDDPNENKCYECEKIYINADRLATHRVNKHPAGGQTMFECDQCAQTFVSELQLSIHQLKHTDDGTLIRNDDLVRRYISMSCDLCNFVHDSFSDAQLHHRTVHDQHGYLTCCGKKFFKKFRVMQHCEWHADPKKFDCKMCGKNFLDRFSLREHTIRLHATDEDRVFQCDMCERGFQQKYQLRYHQQKVHMPDEDKKFECYKCRKRFVFLSFLQNHMKDVHDPVPSFVCDICAKYFRTQSSYELHYALEHSNVCQKVQCKLCGKWLKHAKTLARHMFFHSAKPATCPECGHIAPSKRALYSHRRLVHRDPTHKCVVCGKMFKKTHTLKEHMAIHAGITDLYTCHYCPKTFRSSSNMYKHRKLVHSLEFEAHKKAAAAAMLIQHDAAGGGHHPDVPASNANTE